MLLSHHEEEPATSIVKSATPAAQINFSNEMVERCHALHQGRTIARFLVRVQGWLSVKVSVAQSYLTLCDPMDCSPPGSSVHGIL